MLLFGNLNAAGAAPGADLWQFTAAAPADIELNTGAGVTGIDSQLSFFGKVYRFIQGVAGGLPFVGQVLEDAGAAEFTSAGVEDQGGGIGIISKLEYQNMSTGAIHTHDVTQYGAHSEGNDGTDKVSTQRVYPLSIQRRVRDLATNNETNENATATQHETFIDTAGATDIKEILTAASWRVEDGATNKQFIVFADGKTGFKKYVAAALPIPALTNLYLLVYDVDGNLMGKIPIL